MGRNIGTLTFKDCVFSGRLLGSNTYFCGGFVGENASDTDDGSSSVSFTDYLFAPDQVTVTSSATFSYNGNSGTNSFTRAYYTQETGFANQGTRAYTTASNDRFTVKITAPDNKPYWVEGSAGITGLSAAYALSEANSLTYSVEFDGVTLTSGGLHRLNHEGRTASNQHHGNGNIQADHHGHGELRREHIAEFRGVLGGGSTLH